MKRLWLGIILAVVLLVLLFVAATPWIDDYRRRPAEQRVHAVIDPLGARAGSVSASYGKEYVISFRDTQFTPADLEKLRVLSELPKPSSVKVYFYDTNLTREQLQELKTHLPGFGLERYRNGARQRD